ncbi:MAG: ABC transporter substrate-binding protein [Lachnospiraceae bacterium]|nr:ABC transporter substrate-binding protein [Lachnospiraceae bacterium]
MKKIWKTFAAVCLSAVLITSLLLAGCGKTNGAFDTSTETDIEEEAAADESSKETGSDENTETDAKVDDTETILPESVTVTLNEVAHSVFYAPMYVAIEEGYFEEEGIDLDLVCGYGADKVMAAVLADEADIGFMGPETTVYAANEGANDQVINFAQLTQRAGNFLVAREEMEDFDWSDLVGKTVLGGREGGMPEMVFEYILKQNGIDPDHDLDIDKSIDFGSTAAAFISNTADFTVEFEPYATGLETEGAGYVVASLGVDSGYVPYTAFSAKASYIEENPDVIQAFTNALQKGMDYVNSHTAAETASSIAPQFADTDENSLETIVARYLEQDTWKTDLIFTEESYNLLLEILESADMLTDHPDYKNLVITGYAEKAAE